MMGIELEQIGQIIHEFFSEKVEVFAKQTKFVQRASKLTGMKFLQAIVFNSLEKREMTLSSITQNCLDLGVSITEQGGKPSAGDFPLESGGSLQQGFLAHV
jgi:hypothetical protein